MTRSSPGLPRLVYFGTPAMAVPPLEALVAAGFAVSCVVTRIDKRRGRGGELVPSPVKAAALRLGLRVVHSVDEAIVVARSSGAELGVVVAFGQLIKPDALAALPMVNLHFSLLPRWRGAAPVERALLAGDTLTGVCLMQLDEGLDTGPIHAVVEVPIGADETGASLRSRLVEVGTALLVDQLTVGLAAPVGQVGDATYAGKLAPSDLRLDWLRPAVERHRIVRLGGAWTTLRGKRLKVLEADLVDPAGSGDTLDGDLAGGLRLRVVQPEGRAAMQFAAFSNGARLMPGEPLGRD
ncbi:MAG: methionyl-tRNA formyltransferase [Actinomycetota bacterium]|jgi:methionyl-tRNA formyltransferase